MGAHGDRMSAFACALPTAPPPMPGSRSSTAACSLARCSQQGPAMALSVNLAQINAAARGNSDLRETLTGIHLALQSLYAQTGSGPIKKVDATPSKNLGPPGQCGLSVTGANGSFTVTITLPQQASGSSQPTNPTNAPIYQEVSSSTSADFSSDVTTYPVSTGTSFVFPNPGATLYWRLRSSYDQKTWN